jgi:hypothetical protein
MFRRLKERNGGEGRPEYQIRACFLPHISRREAAEVVLM